jgi:S1-C subfamily serine protease
MPHGAGNLPGVDPFDGHEEDEPFFPWLPPDDRLWRHPSELSSGQVPPTMSAFGRRWDRRVWGAALLAGVIGAAAASGVIVWLGAIGGPTTVVRPIEQVADQVTSDITPASNPKESDVVTIADQVRPAIVELMVDGNQGKATGSGVIFRSDGYALTNYHVVEGANSIMAVTSDGRQVKCRLVGADAETDIAVVKLQGVATRRVATLGTAGDLKVGELAIAIGSPLGLAGGPSVTVGVISALGREVDASSGPQLLDMIQTDAPIAEGSSGGALIDPDGDVVGITTAVAVNDQGPQGLGFATPIDTARDAADQLISGHRVTHVWLGVSGADIDGATANQLGIAGGAVVEQVAGNSPAAKAGLEVSDVITQVDGRGVSSMGSLMADLAAHRPGDWVSISFMHNNRMHTTTTQVIERPVNPSP